MSETAARTDSRLKVATLSEHEPEIIKLSRVIAELDIHTDHVLIHTGQNYDYELNECFFEELGIRRPQHFLNAAGEKRRRRRSDWSLPRATLSCGTIQPDAVLLFTETPNSCLAAIAAKRLRITRLSHGGGKPLFRSACPGGINRKIIDHLSDVNMTLTEHARRYLISEGQRPSELLWSALRCLRCLRIIAMELKPPGS